jgi:outer membrane receptor protein involved in Fe transport
MKYIRTALYVAVFLVAMMAHSPAFAQSATGSIEGTLRDTSGGVLPGVTVVIKNAETNVTRETVSDGDGRYQASALQPGRYEVAATLAGLQAAPVTGVVVQVGQTVTVDMQMRPQAVQETITVTATTPVLDTVRSDVSNVIGQEAIENLPINGRRWENFVLLSPAVTNDGNFGLISYRGISGLYNNNTIDGVDNNQAFFSEARGRNRVVYTVSQAAIREFQVGVSNFSAEFGRAAGGTVNAVTKSGTNNLSGEGFYFLRDDKFQAREPFASGKPNERRQQFGLSAGGPVRRDRVFFFVNYDQQVRDFPGFVRTSDVAFLSQTCTAPGCPSTLTFFDSLAGFFPREGDNRIFLGKIDATLSANHQLGVQYNMHRWESTNGIQTQPILSGTSNSANGDDVVKTDFAVASLNSVLGTSWVNEARVQISRDFEYQNPNSPGPGTSVTGGVSFGMPNFLPRPKYPDERRYQFIDNISYFAGPHSLKAGMDINYVRQDVINLFQGGGVYSYPNLQAIASDCPAAASGCVPLSDGTRTGKHYSNYSQAFDLRGLAGDIFFTTTDYNFFVQDNWKVSNDLTLNLGVRYEYQKLPQPGEASVRDITFTGNPAYPATTRFNQDKNNWGPRIGAAYDIGGRHDTVVRGGYGLYFGRTSNSVVAAALTENGVTFASYSLNPTSPGSPVYPNVLTAPPSIAGSRPTIQYLSPDLERPAIHMADLTVERQIAQAMTVSASYLFSHGTHLPMYVDTNLPAPSAQVQIIENGQVVATLPFYRGSRPDANIFGAIEMRDDVESTYHGLVLQANRRFRNGLLFNTSYTLAKATDTGQSSTTFISRFATIVDPSDLESEEGPSNTDRRHRFVGSVHYAPDYLYGVQVGGVMTLESGLPVNPELSVSMSGTGAISTSTANGSGGSFRAPWLERNSFRQDERKTVDLRISKAFDLGGRRRIVALWEAFNIFNWVNYTQYSSTAYNGSGASFNAATNTATVTVTPNSGFLRPTAASNTLFGPRDMQLGLKFLW